MPYSPAMLRFEAQLAEGIKPMDAGLALYVESVSETCDHISQHAQVFMRSHANDHEAVARLSLILRLVGSVRNDGEHLPKRLLEGLLPHTLGPPPDSALRAAAPTAVEAVTRAAYEHVETLVDTLLAERVKQVRDTLRQEMQDEIHVGVFTLLPGLQEQTLQAVLEALTPVPSARRWWKPWTWGR